MKDALLHKESSATLTVSLLLVTALIASVAVTWSSFSQYTSWLSILLLIFLGIPHGAVDHLIDFKRNKDRQSSAVRFYLQYLLLMGLMGLVWYFSAGVGLLIFIFISAFHFGQSQWHGTDLIKPLAYLIYLSWGLTIISIVVFFNIQECREIVSGIGWNFTAKWFTDTTWFWILISNMFITSTVLIYAWFMEKLSLRQLAVEVSFIFMLLTLSISTDALFAFAIYFGLWHSTRALILEYKYLRKVIKTPTRFIYQLVPYTLISLFGLLIAFILLKYFFPNISFYMVLFVIISLLTAPHLLIMHPLYESSDHKQYDLTS